MGSVQIRQYLNVLMAMKRKKKEEGEKTLSKCSSILYN